MLRVFMQKFCYCSKLCTYCMSEVHCTKKRRTRRPLRKFTFFSGQEKKSFSKEGCFLPLHFPSLSLSLSPWQSSELAIIYFLCWVPDQHRARRDIDAPHRPSMVGHITCGLCHTMCDQCEVRWSGTWPSRQSVHVASPEVPKLFCHCTECISYTA